MKQKNIIKLLKDIDKPLLIVSIAFFVFGLLNIVTASSRAAVVNYDVSIYYYFYKQLVFIIAGLIGSIVILKTDTKYYKIFIYMLFVIAVLLNLWALTSREIGGSTNWIDLKIIKIQPSELSKPIIIIFLALLFEKYYKKLRTVNINHYDIIGRILIIALIIPAIIVLQKDLGTLLITLFIIAMMFLASPILKTDKFKTIILMIGLLIAGLLVIYMVRGYILNDARKSRFTSFLDPCGNYENGGYQVCNSYIAINDGGIFGLGIGKSKQKYSYIPEPHTDSAFAIIAEEYGIYRTVFIFIGYIIILQRILSISSKASTLRGRYICLGVSSYIFAHIFINLGGMFGLIPLTGVPLPFLSYGGSFTLSLIASLTLVQRVNIETKNQKIKIKN
ncbi:MAG: FtsW/RodA/SpoVE family cell cycle protein [Bacilli bacterium]|nr:FtsW/RodA/SpoVE family cell cycle protein [Bacilli bacterium]